MEDLDFLLKYSEDLKVEIDKLPFHRDDIRTIYFTFYYDLVYNLYISKSLYELSLYISKGGIMFPESILEFEKHIQRLIEISKFEVLTRSFNNNINRSFFFDAFSSFEVCLNVFCGSIFKADEIDHLLKHSLNEVDHILKNIEVNESIQGKLNKLLLKTHLTHVPFIRKIETLFKYCKSEYHGNINDDREFLIFLSKLRNTIHTQWVYFGNSYEYFYDQDTHFVFQNGKQVVWTNPYDDGGARLFVKMFDRLKGIWKNFIFGISFDNFIPFYDENV